MGQLVSSRSEHLRCEGHDAHELLLTKLAGDRPEDARTARLALRVQQDRCVFVKPDVRTILATKFFAGANNDSAGYLSLLDVSTGDGRLDRNDDLITHTGISTSGTTENTNTKDFLRTAVVGNFES